MKFQEDTGKYEVDFLAILWTMDIFQSRIKSRESAHSAMDAIFFVANNISPSVVVSYTFSSVVTNTFSSHFSKPLFLEAMQGSCNSKIILKLCDNCLSSETSMILNLIVCKGLMLGPGLVKCVIFTISHISCPLRR